MDELINFISEKHKNDSNFLIRIVDSTIRSWDIQEEFIINFIKLSNDMMPKEKFNHLSKEIKKLLKERKLNG
jgi:hypothetical protein